MIPAGCRFINPRSISDFIMRMHEGQIVIESYDSDDRVGYRNRLINRYVVTEGFSGKYQYLANRMIDVLPNVVDHGDNPPKRSSRPLCLMSLIYDDIGSGGLSQRFPEEIWQLDILAEQVLHGIREGTPDFVRTRYQSRVVSVEENGPITAICIEGSVEGGIGPDDNLQVLELPKTAKILVVPGRELLPGTPLANLKPLACGVPFDYLEWNELVDQHGLEAMRLLLRLVWRSAIVRTRGRVYVPEVLATRPSNRETRCLAPWPCGYGLSAPLVFNYHDAGNAGWFSEDLIGGTRHVERVAGALAREILPFERKAVSM
jgi:hypothetical protein